jgi:cell division protein FtsI (penicillin-binding protein 3)
MSIGYEVQVTPIQLIQAYAAFANDGKMMRPYLVEKIVDGQENIIREHYPVEVRTIANKGTLDKLYPVFKDVVSDSGTAEWAQVAGLPVAGKTGTAQKYIDGQYRYAHRASFVGFFPADDAKYVCLVILDEPKTSIYGGYTAGPVFRQTATRIAGLDNEIQKQYNDSQIAEGPWAYAPDATKMSLEDAKTVLEAQNIRYETRGSGEWVTGQAPEPGTELTMHDPVVLELSQTKVDSADKGVPEGYARIPDLTKMNMRRASLLINSQGFEAKMIGSGTVYTQFPRAGDLMEKGRAITIRGKGKSLETLVGTR